MSDELAVIDDVIETLPSEQAAAIEKVLEALDGKSVLSELDARFCGSV